MIETDVVGRPVAALDTPALVVDLDRLAANIRRMQALAERFGVGLRPHIKSHRLPPVAHMQLQAGAAGITVAKLGEAEVMSDAGIDDIFVANQVVGAAKMARLARLARRVRIAVGVDHPDQVAMLSATFAEEARPIEVSIEIDTGQRRGGVLPGAPAGELARAIAGAPGVRLRGVFTHEGHDYDAPTKADIPAVARKAQEDMLASRRAVEQATGGPCLVSIGSTPSLIGGADILPGIDEIRPGTYVYFDACQARIIGHTEWCAATVAATVQSIPAPGRLVLDAGAKALTKEQRGPGVLHREGFGLLVGHPEARIASLSDEHAVVEAVRAADFRVGQVVEILPNHICPVTNLYDVAYIARAGIVDGWWRILARGRSQ
ncbi:MAG: alanine racemase [Proteobacteria bacterium]|nr:alanine racemase [Pseudomonadota bacterium]